MGKRVYISAIAGWLGSAFAALCCIGFSVLIGLAGALGAGFLIQDRILIPLLAVSLLLSVVGLFAAFRRYHNRITFTLGLASIPLVFLSVLWFWKLGVYLGLATLLATTGWDLFEGPRAHRKALQHAQDHKKAA